MELQTGPVTPEISVENYQKPKNKSTIMTQSYHSSAYATVILHVAYSQ